MHERTRLKLAVQPAFIEFREAAAVLGARHASELPELEKKLEGFVPNGLWLAWIQTVHEQSLQRLSEELLDWIEPPSIPEAAPEPASSIAGESTERATDSETSPRKRKPGFATAAKTRKPFPQKSQ